MISFHVDGDPQGQPRPRARYGAGRKGVYNPPGKAKRWSRTVEAIAALHWPPKPFAGAVRVLLSFTFRRPKSHYGTGRNSTKLKKSAPMSHTQRPDADNLAKLVLDCLTRLRYWNDDSQVVNLEVSKWWTETKPGVWVHVKEM